MNTTSPGKISKEVKLDDGRIFLATASPVISGDHQLGRVCVLRDISQLKEKIYIFFDEIQDIEWGNQIKAIQNLNYPIKIFISGSSSISMTNEVSNAVRRVNFYSMHPLKFSDFLRYKINDKTFSKL